MEKKERGVPMQYSARYPSPVGELFLVSDGSYLTGLWMRECPGGVRKDELPVFIQAKRWLDAYFRGEAPELGSLPLRPEGTAFQRKVWEILRRIPYGEIRTYGDIAQEMASLLGKEKMSAQAVGQAVGRNPISIIVPCHRVLGAKGQITGYAGGLEKKRWLLSHEGIPFKEE